MSPPNIFISRAILVKALIVMLIFFTIPTNGQTDSLQELKKNALRIYIDCQRCDIDFIRSEITFVNYVRDRKEAQLHILVTTQETGGRGTEYTLTFIGQQEFEGIDDTLKYISRESDTEAIIRTGIVRALKLGLVRYVSKTPFGEKISITFAEPTEPTAVEDKWDFWVFQADIRGYFTGQRLENSTDLYGRLSANRVTPDLKVNLLVQVNYGEKNFETGNQKISSFSRSRGFWGFIAFSLDDHWSTGFSSSISSATYNNTKLTFWIAPALEYNVFPYFESTRRQFRFLYRVGVNHADYLEETIFLKTSERLFNEYLELTLELREPWGTISTSLEGSHYFHDFDKYRLGFLGELSLRLIEGLSLKIFGNVSKINDQLSLARRGATTEEILLRQRQLATHYQYYASLGISYTFGSIYSNVVNPRFGN